jgi:hypothetical protein
MLSREAGTLIDEEMTEEEYQLLLKEQDEESRRLDESIVSQYHTREEYSAQDEAGRRKMVEESWARFYEEYEEDYRKTLASPDGWRYKLIPKKYRRPKTTFELPPDGTKVKFSLVSNGEQVRIRFDDSGLTGSIIIYVAHLNRLLEHNLPEVYGRYLRDRR